jgi:AraC-like DNA-binding protein
MTLTYSTRKVHPRDRLSYWVEVVSKAFFRHAFHSQLGSAFQGDFHAGAVGELKIARCNLDPCEARRSALDQARDDIDDLFLAVRLSGRSIVEQDGREAVQHAGEIVLLDTRRPGETRYETPTESVFICVPRESLEARLGNIEALTSRPIAGERPVAGLAMAFLCMLAERSAEFDDGSCGTLANQALDLVALAFSTELGVSGVALSSARATALFRLKSVVEARLCEPDLKPRVVAATAGISVRYANALLSQEGTSVERYILHRRLERCRRALEDPSQSARMIGEIAFSWGFSDLSHFGRRFRAAYGMTPGDYRRRAKETAGPEGASACLAEAQACTPK